MQQGVVKNDERDLILIMQDNAVNAFEATLDGASLDLGLGESGDIKDQTTGTIWNVQCKHKDGPIQSSLEKIMISDEYWYSWKLFHLRSDLVRL